MGECGAVIEEKAPGLVVQGEVLSKCSTCFMLTRKLLQELEVQLYISRMTISEATSTLVPLKSYPRGTPLSLYLLYNVLFSPSLFGSDAPSTSRNG